MKAFHPDSTANVSKLAKINDDMKHGAFRNLINRMRYNHNGFAASILFKFILSWYRKTFNVTN